MSEDEPERNPDTIARDKSTASKSDASSIRFRSKAGAAMFGVNDANGRRMLGIKNADIEAERELLNLGQRAVGTADPIVQKVTIKKPEEEKPMDKHLKMTLIVCITLIVVALIMRPSRYRISDGTGPTLLLDSASGNVWRLMSRTSGTSPSFVRIDRE
jgi:hypothetical protein